MGGSFLEFGMAVVIPTELFLLGTAVVPIVVHLKIISIHLAEQLLTLPTACC